MLLQKNIVKRYLGTLDVEQATRADGAILLRGEVIGVIELKDHKTPDLTSIEGQATASLTPTDRPRQNAE